MRGRETRGRPSIFRVCVRVDLPKFEVDVEQIREFVKLVERYGLEELTLEEAGVSVTIKGFAPAAAPVQVVAAQAAPTEVAADLPALVEEHYEEVAEEDLEQIVAPLVGVFYRSPSPDAPAFIEIGDEIEVGQEIGLIEAMKVFSPIPSEFAGTVAAIPAANGKLVQQGDVLVAVRPRKE
jgi:acetyl-CoA carboxylase biotin carboxyl carrier protein